MCVCKRRERGECQVLWLCLLAGLCVAVCLDDVLIVEGKQG